jgi:hypothetical protein
MSDMQDNTGQQPPSGGTPTPQTGSTPSAPGPSGPTQATPVQGTTQTGASQTGATQTGTTTHTGHTGGDPAMAAGAASGDTARRAQAQATAERTGTGAGTATGTVPRPAPGYDDSQRYEGRHQGAPVAAERPSGAALGLTYMAAAFMMVSGALGFFEGLAAIIRGTFFVVLPNYAFQWSAHAWGWLHLIIGIVVFLVGAALLTGNVWARMAGVLLASISIVANFVSIPYFTIWSIVVIALDAFVIWALLTPRNPISNRNYGA